MRTPCAIIAIGDTQHTEKKIILDFMRFVAIQNVAVVRSPFLHHCFRFVTIFFHPGGVYACEMCSPPATAKKQQHG